jgi:hypothetical protein
VKQTVHERSLCIERNIQNVFSKDFCDRIYIVYFIHIAWRRDAHTTVFVFSPLTFSWDQVTNCCCITIFINSIITRSEQRSGCRIALTSLIWKAWDLDLRKFNMTFLLHFMATHLLRPYYSWQIMQHAAASGHTQASRTVCKVQGHWNYIKL